MCSIRTSRIFKKSLKRHGVTSLSAGCPPVHNAPGHLPLKAASKWFKVAKSNCSLLFKYKNPLPTTDTLTSSALNYL